MFSNIFWGEIFLGETAEVAQHSKRNLAVLTFFGCFDTAGDLAILLPIIPLKQLSGFKWWRTILYVLLSYLATLVIMLSALMATVEIRMYLEAAWPWLF